VNWILDADIQAFFDTVNWEWLVRFLEHRIADRRLLRLIGKWLKAGPPPGNPGARIHGVADCPPDPFGKSRAAGRLHCERTPLAWRTHH
jgi:hypothetical protein